MKRPWFALFALCAAFGQTTGIPPAGERDPSTVPIPMPPAQAVRQARLKADYRKNVMEASQMIRLSAQLRDELIRNKTDILSVKSLKLTEDIEKLAKSVRGRLKTP